MTFHAVGIFIRRCARNKCVSLKQERMYCRYAWAVNCSRDDENKRISRNTFTCIFLASHTSLISVLFIRCYFCRKKKRAKPEKISTIPPLRKVNKCVAKCHLLGWPHVIYDPKWPLSDNLIAEVADTSFHFADSRSCIHEFPPHGKIPLVMNPKTQK